jgi:hypothetical protein
MNFREFFETHYYGSTPHRNLNSYIREVVEANRGKRLAIHFSHGTKVGINPSAQWMTPMGIYFFPIEYYFEVGDVFRLSYGQSLSYLNIIEILPHANILERSRGLGSSSKWGNNKVTWTRLFEQMGIHGIIDWGNGIIATSEMTQGFLAQKKYLSIVATTPNIGHAPQQVGVSQPPSPWPTSTTPTVPYGDNDYT